MTQFPDLLVQIDEGPVVRHRLSATAPVIRLCPENIPQTAQGHSAYWHQVRCWTIISSTEPSQWTTQNGGCKFLGVRCGSPDAVLPTLPPHATIEFLGDSITASLRLLYDGHDGWDDRDPQTGIVHDWLSGLDHQHPVLNWPWRAARLLGLAPIVTGFGGQGLTNPGTNGVPPAGKAFPYVFADIFAVCPHPKANFAPIIREAVTASGDRVWFFDYSQDVITPADTTDGCHLNPSGALRLAVRLASDVAGTMKRNTGIEKTR